ncbi:MAG: transcription-repair coupling factor [Verrucomicrobiota bacterium]
MSNLSLEKDVGDVVSATDNILQVPALNSVLEAMEAEEVCSLTEIPASARSYLLAAISRKYAESKQRCHLLAVVDSIKHQDELASELEAWGAQVLFFPEMEDMIEDTPKDPDLMAERYRVLNNLSTVDDSNGVAVVVTTEQALQQSLPATTNLQDAFMAVIKGESYDVAKLKQRFIESGYEQENQVAVRGQFSLRGGIFDCFSYHADKPIRLEFFGDEVDSIREFSLEDQLTIQTLTEVSVMLPSVSVSPSVKEDQGKTTTLYDYLGDQTKTFYLFEPETTSVQPHHISAEFFAHAFLQRPVADAVLLENRKKLLVEYLEDWLTEGWQVWISCNNEGEQQRLMEWLREASAHKNALPGALDQWNENHTQHPLTFYQSHLLRGFGWPEGKMVVLTDAEIFGRYQTLRSLRRRQRMDQVRRQQQRVSFTELQDGDYVVHMEYGIALYGGVSEMPEETQSEANEEVSSDRQVVTLIFAEGSRLYVPVEQAYLISKYVGVGKKHPPLDTLGGNRWERSRHKAQKAIMDYAAALLKLQAERDVLQGHAFDSDNEWQKEFESSFLYQETPDQMTAIEHTKQDMESMQPMDRLICGDVGFGKTEVAIRAAFKAVMGGKQVAFLAPTTILAQQHYHSLCERMADYPITIRCLSRFQKTSEQKDTVKRLIEGDVDIVVGTHRLTSKDVAYKNLGLVIVDEEQRFGVRQKEKFKEMFRLVDVLTLSATPIPRTLYQALLGVRDMSTIETPPPNRISVETIVCGYDERVIRTAVERELARGGQVYFLHNRVQTIETMARKLSVLVPKAKVLIGHGQMEEAELEEVMNHFVSGGADILVATTIIESGIDIPNANTIIIDRADRFGLADLYQLRGRVGRGQNRAYAILLLPRDLVGGDAGKRVSAIRQYAKLGSGYKIAMRDLEIRGAGNLLGTAQSGHIMAVGFDLYCKLLKKAVAVLKGEARADMQDMYLRLDFITTNGDKPNQAQAEARIPENYMIDTEWRIAAYRDLAELESMTQWDQLRARWKDRFGRWPESVELLLGVHRLKLKGQELGLRSLETKSDKLMMRRGEDYLMVGNKFPRLTALKPKSKLKEIEKWIISLAE